MLPGGLTEEPFPDQYDFVPPRHLIRAWNKTWTCRMFSRLVPLVSRMNELNTVHDPHQVPRAEMKEPESKCQALRSSQSFLCFSKRGGPENTACGLWGKCRTDETDGKSTLVPRGPQEPAERQVGVLSALPVQGSQPDSRNPLDLWPSLRQKVPVNCGKWFRCLNRSLRETGPSQASL